MHGKRIEVTITAAGESKIDLHGFNGEGCLGIVQSFGEGDTTLELTAKPEFYQSEESEQEKELA